MRTIGQVLDKAKHAQKVPSDYKLALVLGIGESALANYRHGRSLPDENACTKLAHAMGEDPAVLTVEMQIQRAKTPEAKQIWLSIAKRLQMGGCYIKMMMLIAIVAIAANAAPALAAVYLTSNMVQAGILYIVEHSGRLTVIFRVFVKNCKVAYVSRKNPPQPCPVA